MIHTRKKNNHMERHQQAKERMISELERKKEVDTAFISWDDPQISDQDSFEIDEYASCTREERDHHRTVKTGLQIFIPYDILKNKNLLSSFTRNNITPTVAVTIIRCLIESCNGDPSKVNLSYTYAAR